MNSLTEYFERPIPLNSSLPKRPSYRQFPVNLDDPRFNEPLVDAVAEGIAGENIYNRTDGWNAPYFKPFPGTEPGVLVRESVFNLLKEVNRRLETLHLELYLLDGFRTIECQQAIYNWMYEHTQKNNPDASDDDIKAIISNYISSTTNYDPKDSTTWTSHVTGGAIDVTLRSTATKQELYMGGVFDDPSEISFRDYYELPEIFQASSASHHEARRNRRLLFWVLIDAGFTSLPAEWWHFDFGDQLWSRNQLPSEEGGENRIAFYGPAR